MGRTRHIRPLPELLPWQAYLCRITSYNVCYTKLLRELVIEGLRQNNLRDLTLSIPHDRITAVVFDLLDNFLKGEIRCPLHRSARQAAGFSESELDRLEAMCAVV